MAKKKVKPLTRTETIELIAKTLDDMNKAYGNDRLPPHIRQQIADLEPEPASKGHICFTTKKKTRKKRVDGTYREIEEEKRDTLKTGRFFTRKLPDLWTYMNGKAIEQATCNINFTFWPDLSITMLTGKDIEQAYSDGVGHSTCMTGKDRTKFIQLFVKNPDKIKMLVISSCGQSGRAMVYDLDDGHRFMDRIYSSGSEIRQKLFDHAVKNKWLYRKHTDASNTSIMVPSGRKYRDMKDSEYRKIAVSDLTWNSGGIPYMDTLKLGCIPNPKTDKLQILHKHGKSIHKVFGIQSTGGRTEADYKCGECSHRSHMVGINHYTIESKKIELCHKCARTQVKACICCDRTKWIKKNEYLEKTGYCTKCFPKRFSLCTDCNEPVAKNSNGDKIRQCSSCEVKRNKAIKTEVKTRRDKGQEISLFYITSNGSTDTLVCPKYMTGEGESEPDME